LSGCTDNATRVDITPELFEIRIHAWKRTRHVYSSVIALR
jgi:hypothetical protein